MVLLLLVGRLRRRPRRGDPTDPGPTPSPGLTVVSGDGVDAATSQADGPGGVA